MEKGKEEGVLIGQKKTAQNLLKLGLTLTQVADTTELPVEVVRRLNDGR